MNKKLKEKMSQVDARLVELLNKRVKVAKEIAEVKLEEGKPLTDEERENEVIDYFVKNYVGSADEECERLAERIIELIKEEEKLLLKEAEEDALKERENLL